MHFGYHCHLPTLGRGVQLVAGHTWGHYRACLLSRRDGSVTVFLGRNMVGLLCRYLGSIYRFGN